ncbi:MAG: 50S ribosomal protein L29 [Polyangiaceae bacterium]|nr:50S ribosomal protein L29 [Myxococcales bacterium]MCB9589299.1 50S ribosomal protein L29 [Polyangiaceae bacterium]
MKAKDLRERSTEDLLELKAQLKKDGFGYRMKNHTSQLDDTSLISKARKDIARIELILSERAAAGEGAAS